MSNGAVAKEVALDLQKYHTLRRPYKWRRYLYIPPLVVLPFCFWHEYENDLVIWSSGLSILALAFLIRIWATKHIGRRIPGRYKSGRRPHLVISGPYCLVRNPLYLGNIVVMMGFCVLSELLWFMPVVFAYFFLLYSFVVRYEEYKLSILFGRVYELYRQGVPRWIPRFRVIREAKGGAFTWFESLVGELQGVVPVFAMIIVLLGKEIVGP
jgi:protein-S-isoprenylcysteine O-methyltransferase Ste14